MLVRLGVERTGMQRYSDVVVVAIVDYSEIPL